MSVTSINTHPADLNPGTTRNAQSLSRYEARWAHKDDIRCYRNLLTCPHKSQTFDKESKENTSEDGKGKK